MRIVMKIIIRPKDIIRSTFHCGGPGGQNVNKVETGVRYVHAPTGVIAKSCVHKTQGKNDDEAMRLLLRKLREHYAEERMREARTSYESKDDVSFGRQLRSYYMCGQRRVVDHRSGVEHPRPEDVLDGGLDRFLTRRMS